MTLQGSVGRHAPAHRLHPEAFCTAYKPVISADMLHYGPAIAMILECSELMRAPHGMHGRLF
jgi:hypothetical protein